MTAMPLTALIVGRTPWSAADALVGLFGRRKSGSRGTRADQGVRPTVTVEEQS
jgi:hypothetical protein